MQGARDRKRGPGGRGASPRKALDRVRNRPQKPNAGRAWEHSTPTGSGIPARGSNLSGERTPQLRAQSRGRVGQRRRPEKSRFLPTGPVPEAARSMGEGRSGRGERRTSNAAEAEYQLEQPGKRRPNRRRFE